MSDHERPSFGLWASFRERTEDFSHRTAVSTIQGEMTFGDLWRCSENLAIAMEKTGVREGGAVALALANCMAFVPAFLSLARLSALVMLVPPAYGARELGAITGIMRPACFLTAAAFAEGISQKISPGRKESLRVAGLGEDLALLFPDPAGPPIGAPSPDSSLPELPLAGGALVKFTSGTTGVPKGILLSEEQVLAEARNVVSTLALTPDDRILAAVPVFHSYGFDLGVLALLYSGATLILRDIFIPRAVLADLSTRGVTVFLGVPSMYRFLLETSVSREPSLSHVRYLLSCTAPLSPGLIEEFHTRYRHPICQHYGASETGAATTHIPSQVLLRPSSVGMCIHGVEVTIVDEEGKGLPHGMDGEVFIRSSAVANGYVMGRPPGISRFRDGGYYTGDIGLLDRDGFLYLRGRVDNVINVGGHKVSPLEVTQVLETHPAVREAAVVGLRDASGEEVVCAVVTLRSPATEKDILVFCRSRLADYKIPRRIDFREAIPRGPSGKIQLRPEDFKL